MMDNKLSMDFWGRVELKQAEAGIGTLKKLCQVSDVNYQTIANQRSQGNLPNLVTAVKLAMSLNCDVTWLLYGSRHIHKQVDKEKIAADIAGNPDYLDIFYALMSTATPAKVNAIKVILNLID